MHTADSSGLEVEQVDTEHAHMYNLAMLSRFLQIRPRVKTTVGTPTLHCTPPSLVQATGTK